MSEDRLPAADLPPGAVRRAGQWTVANRAGDVRAVSSRCRHQRGLLFSVGRTPGYTQLVKAYAQVLRLRRKDVVRDGDDLVVR